MSLNLRGPRRWRGGAPTLGLALSLVACASTALAQSPVADAWTDASDSALEVPATLLDAALGRLHGPHASAGHGFGPGAQEGFLLGVDVGGALPIATGGEQSSPGLALGLRVGYAFPVGLALSLRYDALGTSPDLVANSQLNFVTLGLRYTLPLLWPLPFAEALVGAAVVHTASPLFGASSSWSVDPGGALGLGLSFPLARYVAIDVAARDWLSLSGSNAIQVITITGGLVISAAAF